MVAFVGDTVAVPIALLMLMLPAAGTIGNSSEPSEPVTRYVREKPAEIGAAEGPATWIEPAWYDAVTSKPTGVQGGVPLSAGVVAPRLSVACAQYSMSLPMPSALVGRNVSGMRKP